MSLCQACQHHEERPAPHARRTREYFRVLIRPLRHVAERCGYAIAVHGSLGYDIDLLAVPWREGAISAQSLAEEIRKTAEQIIGQCFILAHESQTLPVKKPCGRLGWAFHLGGGPYIDLSVFPPPAPVVNPKQKGKTK